MSMTLRDLAAVAIEKARTRNQILATLVATIQGVIVANVRIHTKAKPPWPKVEDYLAEEQESRKTVLNQDSKALLMQIGDAMCQ
jgi:hypothetical protein